VDGARGSKFCEDGAKHAHIADSAHPSSRRDYPARAVWRVRLLVAAVALGSLSCRDGSSGAPHPSASASAHAPVGDGPDELPSGFETPTFDVAYLRQLEGCSTLEPRCVETRARVLFHAAKSLPELDARERSKPAVRALVGRYAAAATASLDPARPEVERRVALEATGVLASTLPDAARYLRAHALAAVRPLLAEGTPRVLRDKAMFAAGALHDADSRPLLRAALESSDTSVVRRAVASLALLGDPGDDRAVLATLPKLRANVGLVSPLVPAYVNALSRQHDEKDALELLDAVVANDPEDGSAFALRSNLARALGRKDEAREDARRAVALGNAGEMYLRRLDSGDLSYARAHAPTTAEKAKLVRDLVRSRAIPPDASTPHLDPARLEKAKFASASADDLERRATAVEPGTDASRALGAELFATYTFHSEDHYDACLASFFSGKNRDLLDRLGIPVERDGTVVGVVRTSAPGEPPRYGVTCSICHGGVDRDGVRRPGLPTHYDQGLFLAACADMPLYFKSGTQSIGQLLRYGPGRNDSSSDLAFDPTDIPHLFHLGAYETLRWNGDVVGIENQANHNLSTRETPWPVLRALGEYLRDVPLPPAPVSHAPADEVERGRAVFERACASCHHGDALTTGHLVPQSLLETDGMRVRAVLANSTDSYKIPSLARVSLTAPYLHDGSVASLEQLLDPARLDPKAKSRLAPLGFERGSLGGHRFGLDLPDAERKALVAYLKTL
jgi:tetratricopeptide (TPR) repeat protein